jgi:hypothetical protein
MNFEPAQPVERWRLKQQKEKWRRGIFASTPSYFFVFYFSVHTSTEPTFFEHLEG